MITKVIGVLIGVGGVLFSAQSWNRYWALMADPFSAPDNALWIAAGVPGGIVLAAAGMGLFIWSQKRSSKPSA